MTAPVRHLPIVQNWDCQGCSNCCREYEIAVTEEERARIVAQGWTKEALGSLPPFVRSGRWWARKHRLNHRRDGACVFLSNEGRCRIHERFGPEAKPLACRLYPFILVPAGNQWRVGLRYACPSAAANTGRTLAQHLDNLKQYAGDLEKQTGIDPSRLVPPPLKGRQRVDWQDFFRFVQSLQAILSNKEDRVERRMRKCLAFAAQCRQARFDAVKGGRLIEFLNLVGACLDDDVIEDPSAVQSPSRVGRILFRQCLALYARKDHGPHSSMIRNRLALLRAAVRFSRGTGTVPRVHGWLPETTFEEIEGGTGVLTTEAEEVLVRYYLVKVESLQFCGQTNFGYSFWEGVEALALTLPLILCLIRAMPGLPQKEGAIRAIGMVDNNFGFNRLLGTLRMRLNLRILTRRREIERLIAWYSR